MAEEKTEETIENPEEEETSETSEEEETSTEEGQESSEETPDEAKKELEEKNKKLFERAKKAEEALKVLKGKKVDDKGNVAPLVSADPLDLAKTVAALKDFSPDEMDYIQLIAKGKGITLDEAVKTNEVVTYVKAERAKVADKKKIPGSSTSEFSSPTQKSPEDLKKLLEEGSEPGQPMTEKAKGEHRKYFDKMKEEEKNQA